MASVYVQLIRNCFILAGRCLAGTTTGLPRSGATSPIGCISTSESASSAANTSSIGGLTGCQALSTLATVLQNLDGYVSHQEERLRPL